MTDSGLSDLDEIVEVELPGGSGVKAASAEPAPSSTKVKEARAEAKAIHGFTHLTTCRKAAIKLTEIGPRLTLSLIKVCLLLAKTLVQLTVGR